MEVNSPVKQRSVDRVEGALCPMIFEDTAPLAIRYAFLLKEIVLSSVKPSQQAGGILPWLIRKGEIPFTGALRSLL